MPSVIGTIKWVSDDDFTLIFEKIHKAFTATQSPVGGSKDARAITMATPRVIDPITVYGTLTYTDINQLTSKRAYTGTVNSLNYTIDFDNGPIIEGQANYPGVMPSVPFRGSGIWHDT